MEWLDLQKTKAGKLTMVKSHRGMIDNLLKGSELLKEEMTFSVPKTLNAKLRPYQLEGVKWLFKHCNHQLGACLADDMGLGKTLQVITLLLSKKEELSTSASDEPNRVGQLNAFSEAGDLAFLQPLKSLVVLPASLVYNWERELVKFAPSLSVFKQIGTKRHKDIRLLKRYDVVLTTYQTALKDSDFLKEIEWEYHYFG